ncbi:MAG TPA: AMP-binding protein, partial [Caulobacteraceae bacterium]
MAVGRPLPEVPDAPETLVQAVAARLRLWPDGELWTCDEAGQPLGAGYGRIWRRSRAIAAGLQARKVEPGRIVALMTGDALEFAAGYWACLQAGCVILPLTRRARHGAAEALIQILSRVTEPLLLADTASQALAGEVGRGLDLVVMTLAELELVAPAGAPDPAGPPRESPACLLPTSGSTGQ